jgi:hypothetical protein
MHKVAACQGHFENRPKGGGKSDQRADQNTGKIPRLMRAGPERRAAEPSGEAERRGDPARERVGRDDLLDLRGAWGGLAGTRLLTFFEPVAFPIHLQDVDMMGQPVQQRSGQTFAAQHLGPFLKGKITGH